MSAGDAELEQVLAIAKDAAKLVMEVYATRFEVLLKGPGDPVTLADKRANDAICAALERAFPGDGIVAEESEPEAELAKVITKKRRVWFVDPLDGTKEFADRNGEFAVMIGLAKDGRAHLGAVVLPDEGVALAGRVGEHAFFEARNGSRGVLDARVAGEAVTLVQSRSHKAPLVDDIAARIGVARRVPCGSVGVKVAKVARGEADVYVHAGLGAKLWDTCAPEAILCAAGGRFTTLHGDEFDYASGELWVKSGIVASRASIHDRCVAAARAAIAS